MGVAVDIFAEAKAMILDFLHVQAKILFFYELNLVFNWCFQFEMNLNAIR